MYLVIYNPYLEDQELIQIYFNTSNVNIQTWYPYSKAFIDARAEAFCYPNLDTQEGKECEIYIRRKVPGMSVVIIRIRNDVSRDISVQGSTSALQIANERIIL